MPSTLDSFTEWLLTKGVHIVLVMLFAVIATRLIRFIARRISRRLDSGDASDAVLRPESIKHRRAVASVISSVAIAVLYVVVAVDIANQLGLPIGSLVAPAAVLGAAFGFGAQRIVADREGHSEPACGGAHAARQAVRGESSTARAHRRGPAARGRRESRSRG
jgi:moderate conductance mechanosensitive channel